MLQSFRQALEKYDRKRSGWVQSNSNTLSRDRCGLILHMGLSDDSYEVESYGVQKK